MKLELFMFIDCGLLVDNVVQRSRREKFKSSFYLSNSSKDRINNLKSMGEPPWCWRDNTTTKVALPTNVSKNLYFWNKSRLLWDWHIKHLDLHSTQCLELLLPSLEHLLVPWSFQVSRDCFPLLINIRSDRVFTLERKQDENFSYFSSFKLLMIPRVRYNQY